MHTVVLTAEARRFYEKADRALQRKLDRCFDLLKRDPHHHPNIKRLKGEFSAAYRFRVGDHRVVYSVNGAAAAYRHNGANRCASGCCAAGRTRRSGRTWASGSRRCARTSR